ncbi:pilus (MSHA type) biogenesis protein MshL [Shewanella sp. SR44-3]|uniref:pilus (MSHA type) biogenesis protein MshL n=1 Tax=unclassified Shewanella TaxID=196818 RepID=UPI0015FDBAF8|nr:pilus (MSHA type) biogenesis protein MshL [Shewanella sp. SR44-3]MBB1269640.1 pilus (MSHA type) biogenesis protein MshL [Shewanella sp. SR44-3]
MTPIRYLTPLLSLCLVACQTTDRPDPKASKASLNESLQTSAQATPPPAAMPGNVQNELSGAGIMPAVLLPQEKRFDVSANDVDAKVFFSSLVAGTPLSVAVHPDVQGSLSLSLKGVTLSEVIAVVEDLYGYEVSREGRILRVFPAGMRTETFSLNYLFMEREGLSLTSVSSGRISDGNDNSSSSSNSGSSSNSNNNNSGSSGSGSEQSNGTFIRSVTKSDFWGELQQTLVSIVGNTGGGRQVVVTPQAGLVTIRAYPNEIRQVRTFLETAESHLHRQVILEAKIVEVTLSDGYQQGVQWEQVLGKTRAPNGANSLNSTSSVDFSTSKGTFGDTITGVIGGVTSLTVKGTDFTTMINLLDTQGDVDVLSSPRVTASNNQKAVIKVGNDEYFVTNVSSTTVTGTNPITTPQVELTPFFSGIALDVTPQIDSDGNVLLHVHPSVIKVSEQIKDIQINGASSELPLAQSEIRESDTVIRAASGDVVIIGGLMKSDNIEQISKVPLLGDIPLLGELFTNRSKQMKKTELIIMLKPTVVGIDTWKDELKRSKDLLDLWYPKSE